MREFRGNGSTIATLVLPLCLLVAGAATGGAEDGAAEDGASAILRMLEARVASDPLHADSWRLIGRHHHRAGNQQGAEEAFRRALEIDPQNIALHFDYGNHLSDSGNPQQARHHYRQVHVLGPESGYTRQLVERGIVFDDLPGPPSGASDPANLGGGPDLLQASYQIRAFDHTEETEQRLGHPELEPTLELTPPQRFRAYVEFGALYNSNVTLAPISRQLLDADADSAQGFLNPEFEWIWADWERTRIGTLGRGYFTVNESNLSDFNLASFQPGAFVERDQLFGRTDLSGRIDYVYSLDLFGGERLGDRHAVTTSATSLRPDGDLVHLFWTASFSQFDEDGENPQVESLDGPAHTLGISRFFKWDSRWIPASTLGANVESVDTEGADFRYAGATVHGDLTLALRERISFIPEVSAGYRSYDEYTGAVSRDEVVWRVGGRLRWDWTEAMSVSAVAGYDRFASDNELFDADRTQAGIVWTYLR
ncbi:tetratricopeptide repeat protein [Candidatus Laterigemmans baculatus]|uniref:tetratricopeptide repeat protein n=1 Tax=Candidatus Laterigemmans baculatus TaxID=2770505 RepID=UPI0013D9BA00|nr:tetratricopeptide repeat protein [Candidatus Laterigemmans baculatus]